MTAAKSRLWALLAPALLAALAATAGAQGHNIVTQTSPNSSPGAVPFIRPGSSNPYDQAQLQQIWLAQQQAAAFQQQQFNEQAAAQQRAQAEQHRQQMVNGLMSMASGQPPGQALAGLQSSYYVGYPQQFGYVAGFAPYPQFQGYQDPTAGGMPFANQPAGNAPPRPVAPVVPFDKAQAMKARAFDTPQHRAAVAKAKVAKRKVASRKAPAPRKEPAEKPAPAAAEAASEN